MLSETDAAWVREHAWTPALRHTPPDDLCPCRHRLMAGCEYRHDLCRGVLTRSQAQTVLVGPDGTRRRWPGNGPSASGRQDGTGPVKLWDEGCVWVCPCGCHQGLIPHDPPPWAQPRQPALF